MPYFGIPIRNGLPIGLGSVAGFGVQQFSPADLFSAGEQGAWYDPSDLTTLFTDSAGTTPVTAVEQFVGLMLDKSKGLVLGPELVTNANTASSWAVGGTNTATQDGSAVKITYVDSNVGALVFLNNGPLSGNLTAGKRYKVSFEARCDVGNSINIVAYDGSTTTSTFALTAFYQTFTVYLYFVSGTPYVGRVNDGSFGAGESYWVRNITVRELPGNHATSTGTKRPKLAARYNLLTRTEEFNNAAWVKLDAAITQNAAIAPNGTMTADKLYATTTGTSRFVYQVLSVASGLYKWSVAAKAAEKSIVYIDLTGTGTIHAYFDLNTGTVGNVAAGYAASITSLGSGWYRCSVTNNSAASYSFGGVYGVADANGSTTVTANGTDGIYIWGADLRPASQATGLIGPTYQRVVDAATYDTAGFLPYLVADGVDDAMNTGNIVPGADKAQVFVGLRKLTDAAQGIVAEFSATIASNNGTLLLAAPDGATQTYGFDSKGTAQVDAVASSLAAPRTNVVTGLADIAGDSCVIRVNGADADTDTGDQGAGDYLTYPLYLFGRGGTSVYFNGWMYGLIIRFGPNLSTSQIESTEAYLNQKSGAY